MVPRDAHGAQEQQRWPRASWLPLLAAVFSAPADAQAVRPDKELAALMRMLDKNGDGVISHKEFMRPALRSVESYEGDRELVIDWWEALFEKSDINLDGDLDDDETRFCAFLAKEAVVALHDPSKDHVPRDRIGAYSIREMFDRVDRNSDNQIDLAEFALAVSDSSEAWGWGVVDDELAMYIEGMFEKSDGDRDGMLDEDEFHFSTLFLSRDIQGTTFANRAVVSRLFKAVDTDRDDRITEREVKELIAVNRAWGTKAGLARAQTVELIWNKAPEFDADGDGALDRTEVKELAKQLDKLTEHESFTER